MNQLRILGTGTSTGVPVIGCKCEVCLSNDAKDKRLRTSAVITTSTNKNFLIDTGADLRTQLLTYKIDKIDCVLITHTHADHVHGIDDLRPLCFIQKDNIPVITHELACEELRLKFPYIFMREKVFSKDKPILGGGIPLLDLYSISEKNPLASEDFHFHLLPHGHFKTMGIVHSKMAYFTDVAEITSEVLDDLKSRQLDLFIVDCLRRKPHQTHLHLEQALEYAKYIQAKKTRLIHFSHDFSHQGLVDELKTSTDFDVLPLYDGETLTYS